MLADCEIRDIPLRIDGSLIGRNVKIAKTDQKPKAYRFMLGDNSEVGIHWAVGAHAELWSWGGTGMLGPRAWWPRRASRGRSPRSALSRARRRDVTRPRRGWSTGRTRFRPELLVNCAAFTKVDDCETAPRARVRGQRRGGRQPAAAARAAGARLVHVSTDYVFDGAGRGAVPRGRPDRRRSRSTAQSKLAGERAALAYDARPGGAHQLALRPRRPELRGHHACG